MSTREIPADYWGHAAGVQPAGTFGGDVTPAGCVPAYNFGGDFDPQYDPRECPNCTRQKAPKKVACDDCLEAAKY